jgi:hypothetical protein
MSWRHVFPVFKIRSESDVGYLPVDRLRILTVSLYSTYEQYVCEELLLKSNDSIDYTKKVSSAIFCPIIERLNGPNCDQRLAFQTPAEGSTQNIQKTVYR